MSAVGRALAAFGRFWWDFLVGDTPELFFATVVVVVVALVFGHLTTAHSIGVPVLIVVVVGWLTASVWRGRSRREGLQKGE